MSTTEVDRQTVAIPIANGRLSSHFGQSRQFLVFEISKSTGAISGVELAVPDDGHCSCSSLATLLRTAGVSKVIVGGIGGGAIDHLRASGIEPITVAGESDPERLVHRYLAGSFESSEATCHRHHGSGPGHGHGHRGGHHRGRCHGAGRTRQDSEAGK